MRDGPGHVQVDDAGLYDSNAVGFVDFQDLAHARHLDDDAVSELQGAARQSRAGATRRERDPFTVQEGHHLRGLFSR